MQASQGRELLLTRTEQRQKSVACLVLRLPLDLLSRDLSLNNCLLQAGDEPLEASGLNPSRGAQLRKKRTAVGGICAQLSPFPSVRGSDGHLAHEICMLL